MMRLLVLCSWLLTTPSGVVVAADRKELRFRQLQQRKDPKCRLNKGCANVGLKTGNCCPTSDGTYLSCCFEDLKSESGFCSDRIDNDNDGLIDCDDPQCFQDQSCILKRLRPQCARNKVCKDAGLKDLCCPTKDGVYLTCCKQSLKTEAGFCADGIDNDGNGKIDCADPACASDPACLKLNPRCSKNKACAADGLTGDCCPTKTGQYLACCQEGASKSESGKCSDGVDNDGDGKTDCDDDECKSEDVCVFAGLNPRCSRNTGCSSLSGLCCPTQDGVFLDCCRDSL